jgi:Zn finger protein HypA/HybF involved in hydrogenase expression
MMRKKNHCNIAYCEGCGKPIPSETDVVVCKECSKHSFDFLAELTNRPKTEQ